MNRYMDWMIQKIFSLFNSRISFRSTIINSSIDKTAAVHCGARLYSVKLGRYSYVTRNTLVQNTTIGQFCSISDNCNIGMPTHPTDYVSTSPVFLNGRNRLKKNLWQHPYIPSQRTTIGNDVWIGANVMIKSGVTIGNGAVIGAGAVVTHDVPDYAIVAGVPAKVIRYRFDSEMIQSMKAIKWWDWPEGQIVQYAYLFDRPRELISKIENH